MADNLSSEDIRKISEAAEAFARLSNELNPLTEKSQQLAKQAEKSKQALEKFAGSVADSAVSASKALVSVKDGAGKYASSMDNLGNAVIELGSNFGALGKITTVVIGGFLKLAGSSLKQNEALAKSYKSLSEFGSIGQNFREILGDMQGAGFAIQENAEEYINALKKAAPGLATFAGTVNDGRDALNKTFKVTLNTSEKQLERFGISSEEAFKRTSSYMTQLSLSSNKNKMSNEDLSKASVKYMEALTGLADLTGQSRDEAEKAREAQMTDLRFQLHLREMRASGNAEEMRQAERTQDLVNATQLRYGKEAAEGLKSMLVNNGRLVDDAGAKFYQLFGNKGFGNFTKVIKSSGDFVDDFAGAMKDNVPILNQRFKTFRDTLKTGNDAGVDFGLNIDTLGGLVGSEILDREKLRKDMASVRSGEKTAEVDANTERKRIERESRNSFELLEFNVARIAVPAVNFFAKTTNSVGQGFANMLYKIGGPDLRSAFKSLNSFEDAVEESSKQQEKLNKLNVDKEKIEKELTRLEEARAKAIQNQREGKGGRGGTSTKQYDDLIEQQKRKLSEKQGEIGNVNSAMKQADLSRQSTLSQQQTEVNAAEVVGGSGTIEGLKIKKGDVQKQGAFVDPKLIALAKKIQEDIPGFRYFSSFNDNFHQDRNSLHNKGKALDFVLDHIPSDEEGQKLAEKLRTLGFGKIIDEYNHPSSGATAGHIHAELQAKNGGIFSGPVSGYNVQLHGDEVVSPVSKGVSKQPLSSVSSFDNSKELMEVFNNIYDKLDTLVNLAHNEIRIQDELLTYTKS